MKSFSIFLLLCIADFALMSSISMQEPKNSQKTTPDTVRSGGVLKKTGRFRQEHIARHESIADSEAVSTEPVKNLGWHDQKEKEEPLVCKIDYVDTFYYEESILLKRKSTCLERLCCIKKWKDGIDENDIRFPPHLKTKTKKK